MSNGPYYAPGNYWCQVTNQALGQTSKGDPQFVLSFAVLGKVNPSDPDGELLSCGESYERTIYRTITEKTIDWLIEDVKHLSGRGEKDPSILSDGFQFLDPGTPGFLDLRGVEFGAYCQHDTYEGKTREKWNVSTGKPPVEALDDQGVRKLNALFGKQLKTLSTGAKKPPQSKADSLAKGRNPELAAEIAAAGNDEIPF